MTIRNLQLAVVATTLIAAAAYAKDAPDPDGATVKGSLDKDVIRTVIQKHINEVKNCYDAELQKNQALAGRVMMNFTIGTDGKVTESKVVKTTLGNPKAEKCIADAIHGWEFPKPKSGKVVVTYPFELKSA